MFLLYGTRELFIGMFPILKHHCYVLALAMVNEPWAVAVINDGRGYDLISLYIILEYNEAITVYAITSVFVQELCSILSDGIC